MVYTVEEKRKRLKEIIKERGIVIGDVTLASNRKSKFYYDIKKIVSEPEGAYLIGELMFAKILKIEPKTRSVGGLESGSIAISTAIVCSSFQLSPTNGIFGFFVRKSEKTYGLKKRVEGIAREPAVVVDDVITTGKSTLDAVSALWSQGITNINILSVIDRETNENLLEKEKIPYHSLFKHSEFAGYIESRIS